MNQRVRRILILLTITALALALVPGIASAEDKPAFKRLKVSIWPEYDDSRVLVIWEGELVDGATLPANVSFALPADAEINSACAIDPSGKHNPATVERTAGEDGSVASYKIDQKATDIEFYYNPIEGAGSREISYSIRPLHPVESLQVEIQRPLRSTEFAITPASNSTTTDQQGFEYHRYDYGKVDAGQAIDLLISYEKQDANPSVTGQQSGAPAGGAATGDYALPLLVLGLASIVLILYLFLRNSANPKRGRARKASQRAAVASPPKGARSKQAAPRPVAPTAGARFCTACGASVRQGAAFCSACGQPVRGQRQLASQ